MSKKTVNSEPSLIEMDNIEGSFIMEDADDPIYCHTIILYSDSKNREKEWGFTLNLN